MHARKSWIISVIIAIGGAIAVVLISDLKTPPSQSKKKSEIIAPFIEVQNKSFPLTVSGSGQSNAKNSIDLFSQVNGVLLRQKKDFKIGVEFQKGEILLSINNNEQKATLYGQRSEYQNLIASMLTDINLEFPKQFNKWITYLKHISIKKTIPPIPIAASDKEEFFITSRLVYSKYYSIKNMEARFNSYTLTAPYDGVVTESMINPGALVRSGQKLGHFSNMEIMEISIEVSARDVHLIKVGQHAEIRVTGHPEVWDGKVVRLAPAIDLNTQTMTVFIESSGAGLLHGMFPTATIYCGNIDKVMEITSDLLVDEQWVYWIDNDSTLQKTELKPIRFQEETVLTRMLPDGMRILSKNIPGAFIGMKVNPQQTNTNNE